MLGNTLSDFQEVFGNVGVVDFVLVTSTSSLDDCKQSCLDNADCRFIEFGDPDDGDSDGECILKSVRPSDPGARVNTVNADTFIRTCV